MTDQARRQEEGMIRRLEAVAIATACRELAALGVATEEVDMVLGGYWKLPPFEEKLTKAWAHGAVEWLRRTNDGGG